MPAILQDSVTFASRSPSDHATSGGYAGIISGNPRFMSDSSGDTLRYGNTEYVQNPVDDLQSFMWTALWAAVFNRRALEGVGAVEQKKVRAWREQLSLHWAAMPSVTAQYAESASGLSTMRHCSRGCRRCSHSGARC
ncbi:hypothetical protein OH76DRAFT_639563 [Lentinus brumalis]|uniref:Fungal-type protein kinase domain-containing protein n=1 Tax=Lentinus brumalis TaxID=2498619 RepID=A0A371D7Q2_9APHY|nr:hypothetical protein OH76DRAFT_639563 [Polyporus brumalis]